MIQTKMKKKKNQSHEFAIYYPHLPHKIQDGSLFVIKESAHVQRIAHVLRLEVGESIILFDSNRHVAYTLTSLSKKQIEGTLSAATINQEYAPSITVWLPILKKESLELAVYGLVESGCQEIQLVMTDKVQRKWGGAQELDRLTKIIIAAAEQSKNYRLPSLKEPESLHDLCQNATQSERIFFDPQGVNALTLFSSLSSKKSFILCVGPEGDLTEEEKQILQKSRFTFCSLTPTILRAWSAATLALGMARSLLKS